MHFMKFYIVSFIFLLFAAVTATGKIDSWYCRKYGPGIKNGKFTWWREFNFNPRRMRPLSVVLFLILGLIVLAVPLLDVSEQVMAIAVLSVALVFSVISMLWALEKE